MTSRRETVALLLALAAQLEAAGGGAPPVLEEVMALLQQRYPKSNYKITTHPMGHEWHLVRVDNSLDVLSITEHPKPDKPSLWTVRAGTGMNRRNMSIDDEKDIPDAKTLFAIISKGDDPSVGVRDHVLPNNPSVDEVRVQTGRDEVVISVTGDWEFVRYTPVSDKGNIAFVQKVLSKAEPLINQKLKQAGIDPPPLVWRNVNQAEFTRPNILQIRLALD